MDIRELQRQIKNKQLDDLYIFLGEEIAIQKIYIKTSPCYHTKHQHVLIYNIPVSLYRR